MEGADQADDGGFARARRADQRSNGSRLGVEADAVQHGLLGRVGELDVFKAHLALDGRHFDGAAGSLVLLELGHDLAGAIEAGNRLGQLRADIHHLKDRRNHEGEKHVVLEVGRRPSRCWPSTAWPPSHITSADTKPRTVVDADDSTLVMVSDFITFCSSRSTPAEKTSPRAPPRDSP